MREKARELSRKIKILNLYRNIYKDKLFGEIISALDGIGEIVDFHKVEYKLYDFYYELIDYAEKNNLSGNLMSEYILKLLLETENVFSLKAENGLEGNTPIIDLAIGDIKKIKSFLGSINLFLKSTNTELEDLIKIVENYNGSEEDIFKKNSNEIYDYIYNFYSEHGCGKLSQAKAFRWDKGLIPIVNYDRVEMGNIIGYKRQKDTLIANTKAFLDGKPANNILLAGARGTGKSSSVKALLSEFEAYDLKIIELSKDQLFELNTILELLQDRGKKFIIFMDDLSFEDFETDYKHMKSILEGGVEKKPDNIIMYVTSNRRHLIKETWGERDGNDIHESDAINEKLSLSDRFGITLNFMTPNQNEYLEIVEGLMKQEGMEYNDEIKREAIRWEMAQNGRSGRTAVQFVNYLRGK